MTETIGGKLFEYGVLGIMLAYFLWKDSRTFQMYRDTMQKICDELNSMRKEIADLKNSKDK